jgi:hypothetical protein
VRRRAPGHRAGGGVPRPLGPPEMTPNDLDDGRMICLNGVAPSYPAEFVIFRKAVNRRRPAHLSSGGGPAARSTSRSPCRAGPCGHLLPLAMTPAAGGTEVEMLASARAAGDVGSSSRPRASVGALSPPTAARGEPTRPRRRSGAAPLTGTQRRTMLG